MSHRLPTGVSSHTGKNRFWHERTGLQADATSNRCEPRPVRGHRYRSDLESSLDALAPMDRLEPKPPPILESSSTLTLVNH